MNQWLANPFLLADASTVFTIILVVISFLGWIGNQLKDANQKQEQRQARLQGRGRREQPAQDEIDAFLEEVLGQSPEAAAEERRKQEHERRLRREQAVARREREKAEQERKRNRPRQTQPQRQPGKPQRSRQDRNIQGTRSKKSSSSEDVESHVNAYMSPHGDQLNSSVSAEVDSHLGATGIEVFEISHSSSPLTQDLVSMLQTPRGMQQAILLSEILGKPKSQR